MEAEVSGWEFCCRNNKVPYRKYSQYFTYAMPDCQCFVYMELSGTDASPGADLGFEIQIPTSLNYILPTIMLKNGLE